MPRLMALSLRPPWGYLIKHHGKRVENRQWAEHGQNHQRAVEQVGHWVALHGSKYRPEHQLAMAGVFMDLLVKGLVPESDNLMAQAVEHPTRFATEGIFALARLAEFTTEHPSPWAMPGHFHLVLDQLVFLEQPITCWGQEGMWEVTDEKVKQQLREVYRQAKKVESFIQNPEVPRFCSAGTQLNPTLRQKE
ncbi:hypothetical protein [Deinococcus roseus]|uniref:Uncharacterized protein n=1 Tax=Deinococcus roseus TaxID=392414 RepID=A0ABQ2D5H1_9DEIO|nr:hypothetical protein [Deinococcus roseus]GGJ44315.1 hypothetical protein GCM10008938_33180 [Deinococcus roseus]